MNIEIVPGEHPNVTRILTDIGVLLGEVRTDGPYARIPPEMRPSGESVHAQEGFNSIVDSLEMVAEQILDLVERLAAADPDFFKMRLAAYLQEWHTQHANDDLRAFHYLTFRIDARISYRYPERLT